MNQKKENELNLALILPEEERAKTSDLNTGFDTGSNEWELIVRYSGDIRNAAQKLSAEVKELLGGYALIKVEAGRIDELAALPEVIFIEKPKKLITSLDYSVTASCIPPVWNSPCNLSGEGVVVAVIDSGIDYTHPDFCNDDGTTRLISIYDETTGTEYTNEQINAALKENNPVVRQNMIPVKDISGHGTHVTGIAAGNGRASQGRYRGVAYKASIISVRLGEDAFFNTARLMEGVDYAVRKAQSLKKPVALNISIGNNYGAHDGYSLLENYLNTVSAIWQNVIVAGSGNEAAKGIHAHGRLSRQPENIEMVIGENETSLDIQLWKQYADSFLIYIYAPDGTRFGPFNENTVTKYIYRDTMIYVYYGEPKPYSSAQEIFIQMIPTDIYINAGIWYFRLVPEKITDGEYDFWLPAGSYINRSTGFTVNDPDTTLTIPSTALNVITVGAYDAARNAYADFSGRGYTRRILTVKPDIVAPGVGIMSVAVGGGYTSKTGTSMAAPFVTGSAALMMEWGIIRGNDAFLYGEKVKAYLIKGAVKIPGEEVPSRRTGWGRLCLRDSFPT
ncbi:MAG: S8 family peptidase [Butyrivibrio sp.]